MFSSLFGPREFDAPEAMRCRECDERLKAYRGCREVSLVCPACRSRYPLQEYAAFIDDAFEEDLARVATDRM